MIHTFSLIFLKLIFPIFIFVMGLFAHAFAGWALPRVLIAVVFLSMICFKFALYDVYETNATELGTYGVPLPLTYTSFRSTMA